MPRQRRPIPILPAASGQSLAQDLGRIVRRRREALAMHQNDLALASGVGRRFIIELEAGKPSCHLGKALLVAQAVGLDVVGLVQAGESGGGDSLLPDLEPIAIPDSASRPDADRPDGTDDDPPSRGP